MFWNVEVSEDHSNESKQRLFTSELPAMMEPTSSTAFGSGSRASRGVGEEAVFRPRTPGRGMAKKKEE